MQKNTKYENQLICLKPKNPREQRYLHIGLAFYYLTNEKQAWVHAFSWCTQLPCWATLEMHILEVCMDWKRLVGGWGGSWRNVFLCQGCCYRFASPETKLNKLISVSLFHVKIIFTPRLHSSFQPSIYPHDHIKTVGNMHLFLSWGLRTGQNACEPMVCFALLSRPKYKNT